MGAHVPIPVEVRLRRYVPTGEIAAVPSSEHDQTRPGLHPSCCKGGWRGAALCLVLAQPWEKCFPKLSAFKEALRVPSSAALFVDRSGGRPMSVPNGKDVDWAVMSAECDASGIFCSCSSHGASFFWARNDFSGPYPQGARSVLVGVSFYPSCAKLPPAFAAQLLHVGYLHKAVFSQ